MRDNDDVDDDVDNVDDDHHARDKVVSIRINPTLSHVCSLSLSLSLFSPHSPLSHQTQFVLLRCV
jgi:hypothetical protein